MDTPHATVIAVLLGVGALLKHAFPAFPNRYIPLVTFTCGMVAILWWTGDFSKTGILEACMTALPPTAIHSAAKNSLESDL